VRVGTLVLNHERFGDEQDLATVAGLKGVESHRDVSAASLSSPTVAFHRDVAPILRNSCSTGSSCHGQRTAVAEQRPFFGYADSDAARPTRRSPPSLG
jgi:hypothetical protein